ncbi:MAG: fumarylacetoacetate hydrolase family protein [Gammaproteobacteria bacterium]|nr:fumarylacetoacetate hydrolase family protein [Gammaproteobacteria bacterium]
MNDKTLDNDEWVSLLFEAKVSGNPSPVCSSRVPDVDQAIAYAAQALFIELCTPSSPVSGFKGALTNTAAQQSMGIDVPVSGVLLEEMHLPTGSVVELESFSHAVVETEVGFCIGKEMSSQISPEELLEHVEYCLPMIEIADIGFDDPGAMTIYDFIASGAAAAGYIAGERTDFRAVNKVEVTLSRNGELLHEGQGTDALGDQFNAATWLVNQVVAQGYVVKPGHFLMTGSLGRIQMDTRPGSYVADYGEFGKIEFEIS